MSPRSIAILFLLIPLASTAQDRQGVIYKCRSASGHLTYQTERCPPGTELRDVRVFTDRGVDPYIARKVEADRREVEARKRRAAAYVPPPVYRSRPSVRDCENARSRRDRLRRQIGSQRITWYQELELCRPVQQMCGNCSPGYPLISP